MKRLLTIILVLAASFSLIAQPKVKNFSLTSPDGKTTLSVTVGAEITYTVSHGDVQVLSPSTVALYFKDKSYGENSTFKSAKESSYNGRIETPIYKFSSIKESYNQLDIAFKEGFGLLFRAYDEGVAYRFYSTSLKKGDEIVGELAEFNFPKDFRAYVPYSTRKPNPKQTSFESRYDFAPLSEFKEDGVAFSPILICMDNNLKVALTDADIESYPGMFLVKNDCKGFSLKGDFANIPSEIEVHPTRCQERVKAYSDVMVKIDKASDKKNPRYFPWRLLAIAENDTELPTNNLVYLLASPNRIGDISWIKPGKVDWDWWNDWGVTGVDFNVGINTDTYKYFIDFASANGIEYVVLDEGWSPSRDGDIMKSLPEIDLQDLVSYAEKKNVGLILWCVAYTLDKKLEEACKYYSELGIKGFKIDFMDRDDADVVEMNYRIAECAAKYHLLVDYHGMYKPAGMNRTLPNVINFEGIWGLEQMKWSTDDMISYDVTFPYIRMFSGPVDYTQGAMRNAAKGRFAAIYSEPMSQGTRAHQVASYIVFDSPLVMLADSPTAYIKEQESTDFITSIPTVWDETLLLQGEIGEYIVTARRSGRKWYIAALTDWDSRDISLDLKNLGLSGSVKVKIFKDGINAHRSGTDYKLESCIIDAAKPFNISMAPGGGFAIVIE